jgi:hypothetical protein
MKRFKILKFYIVEAADKVAARQVFVKAADQDQFLESITIKEMPQADSGSLIKTLKEQVIG